MYEIIFLWALALMWIISASIQDLRKREVDDWLNFSLIIFALGFRFFYSLFSEYGTDFNFFYQGLVGLGIFFVIGNLLYYSHFFGGGDAKLLIALGAVLPIYDSFINNLNIFIIFLVIFLFAGFFYTLFSGIFLAVKNQNKFKKQFFYLIHQNKKLIYVCLLVGLIFTIGGFILGDFPDVLLFYFGVWIIALPYLYVFSKTIEEISLIKKINARELQEGDWLYKNVEIGRKQITSRWNGLNKDDITLLRKYKKKVLIRQGIPFIPVFLISFLVLIYIVFNF